MNFWELILIVLVALIVLGPKQLPTIARSAGRYWHRMRSLMNHVKSEFNEQIKLDELHKNIKRAEDAVKNTARPEHKPHE